MMRILTIDTANAYCSIAIIFAGKVIGKTQSSQINQQAEILFDMIEELLKKHSFSYNDFDAFIVTKGPGSFTGIRIGMAAAKGISMGTGKRLYGVSTLEVTAFIAAQNNPENQNNIQAILNAGRNNAYHQIFSHDLKPITPPQIIAVDAIQIADSLIASNIDCFDKIILDASHAGMLACRKMLAQEDMEAEPLYIR